MGKYKLIVTDLDGSLLNRNSLLNKESEVLIKKLKGVGINTVMASGRQLKLIRPFGEQLHVTGSDDYYIALNGALIYKNNELIYSNDFSYADIRRIINIGISKNLCINIYSSIGDILVNPNDKAVSRYNRMGLNYEILSSEQIIEREIHCYRIMLMIEESEPELYPEEKEYLANFNCIYKPGNYYEMTNNASKGKALTRLCKMLNINLSEVLCFGDDDNDVSMLTISGLASCGSNGNDNVKSCCQYISRMSNDENAFIDVIENNLINN